MSDSIIVNVNPSSTDLVVVNSDENTTNQTVVVNDNSDSITINVSPVSAENFLIKPEPININEIVNVNDGGLVFSVNGKLGHIILTKDDIGLGNVDNTSDLLKPISNAVSAALGLKADLSYIYQITADNNAFYLDISNRARNGGIAYGILISNSANYQKGYFGYLHLTANSAFYLDAYENLTAFSGLYLSGIPLESKNAWDSVYDQTKSLSSLWTAAFSNLTANSAFYIAGGETSQIISKYLPLSGGFLTGILSTSAILSSNNIIYADGGNSVDWNSVYSYVNLNSSKEQDQNEAVTFVLSNSSTLLQVRTEVLSQSSNNRSGYATWNSLSAGLVDVRTFNNNNSSTFIQVRTEVLSQSANNRSGYSIVNTNSADWKSVYSTWNSNSANSRSVYSIVNTNSADWNSVYSYVNLNSSKEQDQNETVAFVLNNSSTFIQVRTEVLSQSANNRSGYATWNNLSAGLVDTRTFNNNNSSTFIQVRTEVLSQSANWNSVYGNFNNLSSAYQSVYSNVNDTSADWNSVYSQVLSNSSFWQNTYITVQNNSGTVWNYQGTDIKALTGKWESNYTNSNIISALDLSVRTFVNQNSAHFNSLYSSVCSNSSTYATISFSDSKYIPLSSVDQQLNANSTNAVTNSAITNKILQIENSLNILVPAPTYTAPAATLTTFSPATFEVGQTVTRNLTLGYTQNDGGTATNYRLEKNSSLVQQQATAFTQNINETADLGLTRYTCIVTHLSGAVKLNAIGLPDPRGVITAGTKSINRDYNAYYRQFFGSVNTLPSSPSLVRNLTGLNFTTTNSFTFYVYTKNIAIAIPSSRQLVSIITGSFENLTNSFNLSTAQVPDAGGTPRDYKIYTYTTVNPYNSNFTITLS